MTINEFIDKHGLREHLKFAYRCVHELFPRNGCSVRNFKTELVTDPECDESWIGIRFVTEGSLNDIINANKTYKHVWVRNVPVGKRLMIRLMYDIEEPNMISFMKNIPRYAKRILSEEVLNTAGKGLIAAGKGLIEVARYIQKLRVLLGEDSSLNSGMGRGPEQPAKDAPDLQDDTRFQNGPGGVGSKPDPKPRPISEGNKPSTQEPSENGPRY